MEVQSRMLKIMMRDVMNIQSTNISFVGGFFHTSVYVFLVNGDDGLNLLSDVLWIPICVGIFVAVTELFATSV